MKPGSCLLLAPLQEDVGSAGGSTALRRQLGGRKTSLISTATVPVDKLSSATISGLYTLLVFTTGQN